MHEIKVGDSVLSVNQDYSKYDEISITRETEHYFIGSDDIYYYKSNGWALNTTLFWFIVPKDENIQALRRRIILLSQIRNEIDSLPTCDLESIYKIMCGLQKL